MQNFEERLRTCVWQGRHLSDIIFRKWVINVGNQNCIYYRLFWCWHNFFILKIKLQLFEKHAFFLRHTVESTNTCTIQNTRGQYKFLGLVGKNRRVMFVSTLQTLSSYLQLQHLEVEIHAAVSSEANNCLALAHLLWNPDVQYCFSHLNYKLIIAFMSKTYQWPEESTPHLQTRSCAINFVILAV